MIYLFPHFIIAVSAAGILIDFQNATPLFNFLKFLSGFLILFVLIPMIEFILRHQTWKPKQIQSVFWPEFSLLLVPLTLSFFLAAALWKSTQSLSTPELVALILSSGAVLGAFGITSAHELVHRRNLFHRALGVFNLSLVNFAHWGVEHVHGHHKWVATPEDPATARKGESIFSFWIRCYTGVLLRAFQQAPIRVSIYWLISISLSLALAHWLGLVSLVVWWTTSIISVLLLQTVDYIEHYGLQRAKNTDGKYMPFRPNHSWDSGGIMTNITLFNLGFHSFHHMKPTVTFSHLEQQENAMPLPFGYSIMVLLALLPFVYIPMMDKRLSKQDERRT